MSVKISADCISHLKDRPYSQDDLNNTLPQRIGIVGFEQDEFLIRCLRIQKKIDFYQKESANYLFEVPSKISKLLEINISSNNLSSSRSISPNLLRGEDLIVTSIIGLFQAILTILVRNILHYIQAPFRKK